MEKGAKEQNVELYQKGGKTWQSVRAWVSEEGNLVLEGHDLGERPEQFFGVDEYEYFVSVKAEHKDRVLLALLRKLYGGHPEAVEEFRADMKASGIPSEFFSHP